MFLEFILVNFFEIRPVHSFVAEAFAQFECRLERFFRIQGSPEKFYWIFLGHLTMPPPGSAGSASGKASR